MTNAGIDYGLGRANIDRATGIRYGVISLPARTKPSRVSNPFNTPNPKDKANETL